MGISLWKTKAKPVENVNQPVENVWNDWGKPGGVIRNVKIRRISWLTLAGNGVLTLFEQNLVAIASSIRSAFPDDGVGRRP
jgi:hypothetical protein